MGGSLRFAYRASISGSVTSMSLYPVQIHLMDFFMCRQNCQSKLRTREEAHVLGKHPPCDLVSLANEVPSDDQMRPFPSKAGDPQAVGAAGGAGGCKAEI